MIAGITAVVYARSHRLAHEAMRNDLRVRAKTLAGALEIEGDRLEYEASPKLMPEYQEPGSGAYAAIYDPTGKLVVRSPSLGENPLLVRVPWRRNEFVFEELAEGPDGIPCATVTLSFLVGVAVREDEEEGPPWSEGSEKAEERRFQIRVALDRRGRDRGLATLALFLALTGGGALVVTIGGGLLLARRVLRPLRRMTEEAARLSPEDTSRRLGPDTVVKELHSLATTLNSSLDRLGDALERQRRFTSDAGHELRTPVSVLLSNAELLLRRPRSVEEYREGLARQHRIARRMSDITENLLTLARADASGDGLRREVLSPADLVSSMCDEFRVLAREKGVRIRCVADEQLRVLGDPHYLQQVVQNLLSNALKFASAGGRVSLELAAENGEAVLTVADTGPGIPPAHRVRVFDRFYRVNEGKDREEGAGLGLAIVDWVVRAHGGRVTVDGEEGEGATFTVRIPLETD